MLGCWVLRPKEEFLGSTENCAGKGGKREGDPSEESRNGYIVTSCMGHGRKGLL